MPGKKKLPLDERLAAYYEVTDTDCFQWVGGSWTRKPPNGYGLIQIDGVSKVAHRVAYELLVGPIPDGMQLDHLCRNRACINPDHLEPVTPAENTRRGSLPALRRQGKGGGRQKQAECSRGHALTSDNRYKNGACRECGLRRAREYKQRKKATA